MSQFHGDMSADDAPDWKPAGSARNYQEGEIVVSSVGQRWQNRGGYWVRIKKPVAVAEDREMNAVLEATLKACDWPDQEFKFEDDPGEHDPCYVVMPGGSMLPVNHHAGFGVDQYRALFIINACNEKLARLRSGEDGMLSESAL